MIYDLIVSIYRDAGGTPLHRSLQFVSEHLYAPKEVYYRRYFDSVQAGDAIDRMIELARDDDIRATDYAVPEDGHVYRVVQAQHGWDANGLPITTLSLSRVDDHFDLGIPEPSQGGEGNGS